MSAAKEKTKSRYAHLAPVKPIINKAANHKGHRPVAGNGEPVRILGPKSLKKLAKRLKTACAPT